MPTLEELVERPGVGLRLLAGAGDSVIDSALIAVDDYLTAWDASGRNALQGVLLIAPMSGPRDRDRIDASLSSLREVNVGGVVLAGTEDAGHLVSSAARHAVPLLASDETPARVWARVIASIRRDSEKDLRSYGDHLRAMQRLATQPDGLRRLLRWLAEQVAGRVALLDHTRAMLQCVDPPTTAPNIPEDFLDQAADAIERVASGQASSASVNLEPAGVLHVLWIADEQPGALLVVARAARFPAFLRTLVGDVARLLLLRWRHDNVTDRHNRAKEAETHLREAVLHLLMVGDLQGARRAAHALGPALADQIRVYIVECPPGSRVESMQRCDRASGGRAWIVPCPVYTRHVIVLAPAPHEDAVERALCSLAGQVSGITVGASETVALRDTASGYEQAFHALAVGKASTRCFARFSPRGDLAVLLRSPGLQWAKDTLAPLLNYQPSRWQDPDGAELRATLASWLNFYGGAARQLKIHRNTLSARLHRVKRLLGHDLEDIGTQATLHLALRILHDTRVRAAPETAIPGTVSFETLLDRPEVRGWADAQLSPLRSRDQELVMGTLRTWLANNARLDATAAALGISIPGARKRLIRIEETLKRSLLNGPSARYDMWLAIQVHNAASKSARSAGSDEP